eukprot:scaffold247_cov189-Alexandrium_tamarense.AAC.3
MNTSPERHCQFLDHFTMSELYTAITLDQTEVVKTILAHDHCHVNRIDKNGDQPAHLAARLNRIECIKILIEHDARMGRKNFNNLTPLGEAQMNGHTEIVSLIKDNYTTNASQEHWNDEINREYPDGTTEVSPTPPPVEMQRVIALREMYGERKVVRRIHPGSLPSQQQLEYEKKKHLEEQRLQLLLMKSRSKIVEE